MIVSISSVVELDIWEVPYILESFKYLSDLSDDYNFIIARTNNSHENQVFKNLLMPDKKNILILLSDELGIQNMLDGPYYMRDNLFLIFRTYNNKDLFDNEFLFPIPCGFSCGVGIHSSSGKKTIHHDFSNNTKPLKDRKYDFFFSGQIDWHRQECVNQLNKISSEFNCIINSTPSFGKGYSLDEYYKLLGDTKIAIVPRGMVIPESFRYFEASKSNCVIVSSYPINDDKYKIWYYENSKTHFINSWDEVSIDFIKNILSKIDEYDSLNSEYFNEKISPKAVSNYIRNQIYNKENE
jgi:hypothetical protein